MTERIAVQRAHQLVLVKQHPQKEIRRTGGASGKAHPRLGPERTVGIEEVSLMEGKELRTVFIGLDFLDDRHKMELFTRELDEPIEAVLNYLFDLRDDKGNRLYAEYYMPSHIKMRREYKRDDPDEGGRRPGLRKLPKAVILTAHRWDLLFGRLFRNNPQMRKSVKVMADGITIHVGSWKLIILKNLPGGDSANFAILAIKDDLAMRLVGRSIKGQSATATPVQNAEAYLGRHDLKPPPDSWRKKQLSSLTEDEKDFLLHYVSTSANIARQLYDKMLDDDISISPFVTRRDGTHPPSVAGAAIRVALSMLEVESFERPRYRVQQMGALIAAGGRSFQNVRPGYYEHLYLYDYSLFYGFLMSQLPSPATCDYVDIEPGTFDIDQWRGQHGGMLISGVPHTKSNHALRVHDPASNRLKYLDQPFIRQWFPIPDIVYGVVREALTVTNIHDGIHIVGSNEDSFLRRFAVSMNEQKEQQVEGSPLYNRIKNMVHVIPGKMLQINTGHPYVDELAKGIEMPIDTYKFYARQRDATTDMLNGYYEGIEELYNVANGMYKHSKYEDRSITFGDYLFKNLGPKATTGHFYLPMHGSNILGEASARLAMVAEMTGAPSGYTDSIISIGDASEGIAKYNAMVRMAGYMAPETGMGSLRAKIKDGYGYLVKPGQWVIRYYADDGSIKQKHALHNLGELEDADDDTIWNTIKKIATKGQHSYDTKPRPATYMESIQLKIEPGTLVSHRQVVSLQKEEEAVQDATRTQNILVNTTNALAYTSEYRHSTTETARGCIKVLSSYGYEYTEIATMVGISLDSVKAVASGRKSGSKSLDKLQQVVCQVERDKHQEMLLEVNGPPPIVDRPKLAIVPKMHDPIIEEFNKLDAMKPKIGTTEWLRLRELSDILLEREDINDLAQQHFGYEQLRDEQALSIEQTMQGRDTVIVIPTGGGKSAIFQVAALKSDGLTVVISPLIALMNEQVLRLIGQDISATYINSSLGKKDRAAREKALLDGKVKLLYIAPESLEKVMPLLNNVTCIAVDEAHCISQYGHEFRPKYRKLAQLREQFPKATVSAFTASATPAIVQDIIEQLHMRNPYVYVGSFDRPNLEYRVVQAQGEYEKRKHLLEALANTPAIVYAGSKVDTEIVAKYLHSKGIRALPYHADLTIKHNGMTRTEAQRRFTDGEVDVIVATTAFGMGIDKANVRTVVHFDIPDSIERYHQETGRAGRDGQPAQCILLYCERDVEDARHIIEMIQHAPQYLELLLGKLELMQQIATNGRDIREQMLAYFTSSGT